MVHFSFTVVGCMNACFGCLAYGWHFFHFFVFMIYCIFNTVLLLLVLFMRWNCFFFFFLAKVHSDVMIWKENTWYTHRILTFVSVLLHFNHISLAPFALPAFTTCVLITSTTLFCMRGAVMGCHYILYHSEKWWQYKRCVPCECICCGFVLQYSSAILQFTFQSFSILGIFFPAQLCMLSLFF